MTIAKDILDEVRSSYLNDPNGGTYTDVVLLPQLRTAYRYLQCELESNGIQCKNAEITKVIPTNTDEYYPLPTNLVIPREMFERQVGSTDEFRPMTYRSNIPQVNAGPMLEYWTYRLERIFFLPATQDREVKLVYQTVFPELNTSDANVFGKAEIYLAGKVAALAFLFILQNPTLAEQANKIAEDAMRDVINTQVKLAQAEVIRRKGYLPFRSH
jgi:hypothetical protein